MPYIDGIRERLGMFIAILLAGCSTSGSLLVDPRHYSVYHCDAMPEKLKGIQKRQQELSNLMARASEGGGGVLIGTMAYRADYESAIGEEKVLRRAAAEKNCNLPPAAPAVAPTPAAYSPQTAFQSDQGIQRSNPHCGGVQGFFRCLSDEVFSVQRCSSRGQRTIDWCRADQGGTIAQHDTAA